MTSYFKRTLFKSFIFLFLGKSTAAQVLLNSTGYNLKNNSISIEYSIGEISISTLGNIETVTTQGLLQPFYVLKDCNVFNYIPTGFSPNNDNLNDCFGVRHWPFTKSFELSVFNRWGQLVFTTNNAKECWNGKFQGQTQPTGIYVYIIKAYTEICGTITHKGTITLLR